MILIEFALAIPILLVLLYYMHDLPKYVRIREQMELCAHCAINMFQNISQNRENKRITLQDFKYISCVAFLPHFGGGVKQYGGKAVGTYALRRFGQMVLLCVKGMEGNKAQIMWTVANSFGQMPPLRAVSSPTDSLWHVSLIMERCNLGKTYDVDQIQPGLTINKDEIKMILEIGLWCDPADNHAKNLGFYLFNLRTSVRNGLFNTVVIFTPKPELFDETRPT